MRICIEGPSAVGKTTLCRELESKVGAYVLDETIIKPIAGLSPFEEARFYLKEELNRWKVSEEMNREFPYVIFDTDPLKSLWFNWSLGYENCMSLQELDDFFQQAFSANRIGFCDLYMILNTSDAELHRRKTHDRLRERNEFHWVSCANSFRQRYYEYLSKLYPDNVMFIGSANLELTVNDVTNRIFSVEPPEINRNAYNQIIGWLVKNS